MSKCVNANKMENLLGGIVYFVISIKGLNMV